MNESESPIQSLNRELAQVNDSFAVGDLSYEKHSYLVIDAHNSVVDPSADKDRYEELVSINTAVVSGSISLEDAEVYRGEVLNGPSGTIHLRVVRQALLPSLAIWAIAYRPGLVSDFVLGLAFFPLVILWGVSFPAIRPPRKWLSGIAALVSGPFLILLSGIFSGYAPATFVFLYCLIEVLSIPLGGILILVREEGYQGRLDFGKTTAIIGAPIILLSLIVPSTSLDWGNLSVTDLVLACMALVAGVFANAKISLPPAGVTPAAFRSLSGLFWFVTGLMVFPLIAGFIGRFMRTSGY
ncbi:MAG: hypothetical protein ACYTDT_00760 [Planctomycetota bacterium]|jgi:hypothetical protein